MSRLSSLCPHLSTLPMEKPWGKWLGKTNDPWLLRTWERVYCRNQNYLAFVDGPTGSGKSESCLAIAEMQDPHFNPKRQIVFDIMQFVQLVKNGGLPKGSVIVFEEAGVAASNRNWFLAENKILSFINQIFRTKNYIVYYNAPEAELAEKNLLRVCHAKIETIDWSKEKQVNYIKIFDPAKYNAKKNEWFKLRVMFRRRGKLFYAHKYNVHRASKKTLAIYKTLRQEYVDRFLVSAEGDLMKGEAEKAMPVKKQLNPLEMKVIAQELVDAGTTYMDERKFYAEKVMEKYGIGAANVKRIKEKVKILLRDNNRYAPWADG